MSDNNGVVAPDSARMGMLVTLEGGWENSSRVTFNARSRSCSASGPSLFPESSVMVPGPEKEPAGRTLGGECVDEGPHRPRLRVRLNGTSDHPKHRR